MRVFCARCGRESDSRLRYCGMCGAELPRPLPAPQPETPVGESKSSAAPPPSPVSGPSFLGLADEPASPTAYLLEDEMSRPHRGRPLALLFIIMLAAAGWYWRHDLRDVSVKLTHPTASTQSGQVSYSASPISTSGSEVGAMPNAESLGQTQTSQSPAPPAVETPPSSKATQAETVAAQPASAQASPDETEVRPAETVPSKKEPPKKQLPATDRAPDSNAAASANDALEAEGERYLYGTGSASDCSRAQRDLLIAADRANTKAQTVLASMYATGHCVPRDLPLAYRWFARALQQEPHNPRFEQDVRLVWNQMSADEKQIATRQ